MIIADLAEIAGRTYPARRKTQNLVGGASPIQAANFSLGHVTLEPNGGQVPWHNQEQEEIYFIVEGTGEMCLGEERQAVCAGQAVYKSRRVFPSVDEYGRHAAADDLLLWAGGGCGALAAGTGWDAAACRPRSTVAACGFGAPAYGESLIHRSRHYYERRHRTHGAKSALAAVDLRDYATGRSEARRCGDDYATTVADWAECGEARGDFKRVRWAALQHRLRQSS